MPLHGARNYRKLVGDVYNCCGFNPRPFYATSRGLVASFTNRTYPLTPIADLNSYIVLYVALCRRKLNGGTKPETSIHEMFFVNLVCYIVLCTCLIWSSHLIFFYVNDYLDCFLKTSQLKSLYVNYILYILLIVFNLLLSKDIMYIELINIF